LPGGVVLIHFLRASIQTVQIWTKKYDREKKVLELEEKAKKTKKTAKEEDKEKKNEN